MAQRGARDDERRAAPHAGARLLDDDDDADSSPDEVPRPSLPSCSSHSRSTSDSARAAHPSSPVRSSPASSLDVPSCSDAGSLLDSPVSSPLPLRSRFSDLSTSLRRADMCDMPPKLGMTVEQAERVIAQMAKLNDELSAVVGNLRARQEESDHIHGLLIERAERAAQRIMFLQNRIAYLEQELEENDDELQHLRICLKAVEIQMPPHPDRDLQRCITTFKHDYQALKKKRAGRTALDSSSAGSATYTQ